MGAVQPGGGPCSASGHDDGSDPVDLVGSMGRCNAGAREAKTSFEPHKPAKLDTMKHVALGLICVLTTAMPAIAWEPGDDWRDDQCESVIDGADRVANVCRGVFRGGEVFLGIYWNDGAEVVGPCKATASWPMEYRGLSRADAYDWLVEYCGW